jgi:hypothetical protein
MSARKTATVAAPKREDLPDPAFSMWPPMEARVPAEAKESAPPTRFWD